VTKHRLAVASLVLLPILSGCGFLKNAGSQTTQERQIFGVTAVQLRTSGNLRILVGTSQKLTVTAGSNQLSDLTSDVQDGSLVLDAKANMAGGSEIRYQLTVPPLTGLEVSGSGNAAGDGVLTGDVKVSISGSGSAELTGLDLGSLVAELSGSGNLALAGRSTTARITISGSGDYNGRALANGRCEIELSGSGNARVEVSDRLTANVQGSGSITYAGNPKQIDRSVSGSGRIVPG